MHQDFAIFHRDFKCTCYCLDRPEFKGFYATSSGNSGKSIGVIREPFTCCDPYYESSDSNL